jgi:peroxiredoxin
MRMAESNSVDHAVEITPPSSRRPSARIFSSIGVALVIVLAAWFLAGRQGLGDLGQGGVNQKLLPREGDVAPDITITNILGEQVTLSSLRGQAVWLNFWGSWCAPCRSEMPDIETAYQQLAPKGIVLLAVSLDEPAFDATLFAARNNVTFPIYSDQYRVDTGAAYPIYNFPTHLFIDKNGIVRHVVLTQMTVADAVSYAEDTINAS